ncbi:cytochrome c biogenesis CcdA family protein [Thermobrachium celere]|uniref:Probable cytochrome c biogenesis protein CcdA n=1 Tax=Thermobrachium celere DSM 8682 TaxID=941824 RepID=R7RPD7_9CLOT|nr:cytochrome c biogenesis protein CcdA [Thermobrachium celere]GFR34477.1 cytochrome C biogenesis protein CcdA [Thermobrachium celere]CDF57178.1 probable cytochrome c biogenesis protein CcdA [Thermobrachium celere DSM 8682]
MERLSTLIVFSQGLLSFLSPCFLPLIPIYLSYISGEAANKKRTIYNTMAFILGFTIMFTSLGALSGSIGRFLLINRSIINKVLGIFIIIMGLFYTGIIKFEFLNREFKLDFNYKRGSLVSSFLLGVSLSVGWTPCISPILSSVLMLAASRQSSLIGAYYLLVYSLGLLAPFLIFSIFADKSKNFSRYILRRANIIKIITGTILVLTGVLLFTGKLYILSNILGGF